MFGHAVIVEDLDDGVKGVDESDGFDGKEGIGVDLPAFVTGTAVRGVQLHAVVASLCDEFSPVEEARDFGGFGIDGQGQVEHVLDEVGEEFGDGGTIVADESG